jgi:hypothetical protein
MTVLSFTRLATRRLLKILSRGSGPPDLGLDPSKYLGLSEMRERDAMADTKYYKVVAYKDNAVYVAGKLIETLEDAERFQAHMYAEHPGTDFYVE